jgi:hypothetical protein
MLSIGKRFRFPRIDSSASVRCWKLHGGLSFRQAGAVFRPWCFDALVSHSQGLVGSSLATYELGCGSAIDAGRGRERRLAALANAVLPAVPSARHIL